MTEAIHERFGPFRVLARIGRGGMAETFVAEHTGPAGFGKHVCLKRIIGDHSDDPDFVRLFQDEARLAATLRHPNIVQVHHFGCEDGKWWMSLELVDGIDLRSLIAGLRARGERIPIDCVLFIAAELSKALQHAHGRRAPDGTPAGLVHRDVSPSNVLISYEGSVMLADFGIAKAMAQDRRTQSGMVKGKAPYMAPEQAQGLDVDGRVDLFALGVILFELLAGKRPFDGASEVATLMNIVANRREELRELAPDTPPELVALVDALIEPDRGSRLKSAGEVLDALAALPTPPARVVRVLGGLARSARPPDVIPPEGALTQRLAEPSTDASGGSTVPASPRSHEANAGTEGGRADHTPLPQEPSSDATRAQPTRRRAGAAVVLAVVLSFASVLGALGLRDTNEASHPATLPIVVDAPPTAPDERLAPQESAPAALDGPTAVTTERAESVSIEQLAVAAGSRSPAAPTVAARGSAQPHTPPRDAAREATLRIVVHPVGHVVLDGNDLGESPVTLRVRPGRHVIEGVRGVDRTRQIVDLLADQEREVILRLPLSSPGG